MAAHAPRRRQRWGEKPKPAQPEPQPANMDEFNESLSLPPSLPLFLCPLHPYLSLGESNRAPQTGVYIYIYIYIYI